MECLEKKRVLSEMLVLDEFIYCTRVLSKIRRRYFDEQKLPEYMVENLTVSFGRERTVW